MISESAAKKYCCEDISLIENYKEAINSNEKWECHHKLEIELNKGVQELKDLNLYFNRPANELIFLTKSEHTKIHNSINKIGNKNTLGKHYCLGEKNGMYGIHRFGKDSPMYGKTKILYIWKLPDGTTKIMDMANVHRWHPDWIKIGEA